jgi:hypothetical protein
MRTLGTVALVVAVAVLGSTCGGGESSTPAAPTPTPTPTITNVAGVWTGTARLTSVSGGECVGATLAASIGSPSSFTFQVTQSGSTLTAVWTSTTTGIFVNYSGTAGAGTMALNATASSAGWVYGFLCSNGQRRDAQLTSETFTANVNGNSASGTIGESINVYLPGTTTGVGILTGSSSFSMTR